MVTVLLLNGVGSAGKSSIAKALQEVVKQPFLHVEMDAFLTMLPKRYMDHPEGLSFEQSTDCGDVSTYVKTGPVAERALSGMRQSVAALAHAGNNLIVDDVLFGNTDAASVRALSEYRSLLAPFDFKMVGFFASLDVLEDRERSRGDRAIGLARWQYNRVHHGMTYDLSVQTEDASPQDCARLIKATFNL